jgi:uncharacterized protein YndB with AHSA1/START domain
MATCAAEGTVVIARPLDDVFAYLANAENDREWRPVVEITRIRGQGVGTEYRQRVRGPGGRPVAADIVITEFDPGRVIAFRTTTGPVRPEGRFELCPTQAGTEVRFRLQTNVHGLKRLMAPMVRRAMRNEVGHLTKLKHRLEKNHS